MGIAHDNGQGVKVNSHTSAPACVFLMGGGREKRIWAKAGKKNFKWDKKGTSTRLGRNFP